ncbi:metallophosphoesterase [Paenibacillus donghaensis]|uniref:Phosphoesterase n=1 Tax=Paenibacillus donghaensis TaxID=414771 RepID=A0A2Z2K9E7_9BACL|nr:metallophosphoesterase [Paenibacillus donghaensis]ASA19450.1 phosphoesterase [Paenibacillus donghaensis]
MFILLGIAFLLIYGVLVFYIGWSGWRWMKPVVSARFKLLYIITLVFLALSLILGRMFGSISLLSIIGSYWLAVFSLLLLLLPIVHLMVWLTRLTRLPHHQVQKWAGFLTLAALISLIIYGSYQAYSPVVRVYDVKISKQAGELDTLNIVMASDMHFGLLSDEAHAKRMVERINALRPDLVLYPGDLIDDNLDAYRNRDFAEILSGVQAKYGVYASLGNHDKFDGPIQEIIDELERSKMTVLYDESVQIPGGVTLVGRKDRTETDRAELATLLQDTDSAHPLLLLEHQPHNDDLELARQNGIDLMVSGHTHRGQIAPAHLITQAIYENDWGLLQKGSFHSIVTSGFGFWGPPLRIGSRAEIVQINVTFEQE